MKGVITPRATRMSFGFRPFFTSGSSRKWKISLCQTKESHRNHDGDRDFHDGPPEVFEVIEKWLHDFAVIIASYGGGGGFLAFFENELQQTGKHGRRNLCRLAARGKRKPFDDQSLCVQDLRGYSSADLQEGAGGADFPNAGATEDGRRGCMGRLLT
jgi:hypothetical protein